MYKKKTLHINWRFFILCGLIFLSLIILISRMLFLQIIHPDLLIHEGDLRTLRIQPLLNTRGIIQDRLGHPLAITILVNAICADPKKIISEKNINQEQKWKNLSETLSIPLEKIIEKIYQNKKSQFIYLARQVSCDTGKSIESLHIPGIFLIKEYKRYYPLGEITSQLIGITNIDGVGIDGVEKSFNTFLTGIPGKRKIRKNYHGQIIENTPLIKKSHAQNLILSINQELQSIVYNKLKNAVIQNKADSGTAVLIDIHTGEILAMTNSPACNPNNTKNIITKNLRNRAITDMFEPGSTVKPIVIMEALKLGIINTNSVISTEPFVINQHKIQDVAYSKELTITGILQKSSNVGVSKIALSMSSKNLVDSYMRFGLGKPTELGLSGEKSGVMPIKKKWSKIEQSSFSFGYGLMITPLQLARLYAIIGSYGISRPISILKVNGPVKGIRTFPKKYVKHVIYMMEKVSEKGGGGIQAAVKGYRVAVKTGTVKKVGKNKTYIKKYVAYTAGIAPVSDPQFSLIIVIENPTGEKYYGGSVSAPVFSSVMESILKIMKVKPDHV